MATPATREAAVDRALAEDCTSLTTLTQQLGLARYRWLPRMLRWEFQRHMEEHVSTGPVTLEVSVPDDLPPWASLGKAPKQKPSGNKDEGFRLEDLERNVTWFVACEVLGKRKKRLAIEQGLSRSTVQNAIKRVQALLDCINHPLLDRPVS